MALKTKKGKANIKQKKPSKMLSRIKNPNFKEEKFYMKQF